MKGTIIFVAVLVAGALFYLKPWGEKRYDDTPQGVQARKTDKIVDTAIRNKNIWEARAMVQGEPKIEGVQIYQEFLPIIESLYAAGATDVSFAYIKRSVRTGNQAEGMYVVLPKDPTKRAALMTIAQKWQYPPKECNQKYIYMRIGGWDVEGPEPSFLGT